MLSESDGLIEEHESGKLVIFERNGIFQARIYRGGRSYLYKSLKTRDLDQARKAAIKLWHEMQFKVEHGLPVTTFTVSQVIKEYVALRQKEHEQAKRIGQFV